MFIIASARKDGNLHDDQHAEREQNRAGRSRAAVRRDGWHEIDRCRRRVENQAEVFASVGHHPDEQRGNARPGSAISLNLAWPAAKAAAPLDLAPGARAAFHAFDEGRRRGRNCTPFRRTARAWRGDLGKGWIHERTECAQRNIWHLRRTVRAMIAPIRIKGEQDG